MKLPRSGVVRQRPAGTRYILMVIVIKTVILKAQSKAMLEGAWSFLVKYIQVQTVHFKRAQTFIPGFWRE